LLAAAHTHTSLASALPNKEMPGVGSKTELLKVLSDVKARVVDKLGMTDFPIPQFILIGKQSVGKSRLIETLAGEQFNFCSGTLGSRRPTVLLFRNVPTLPDSKWSVRDMKSNKWSEYPIDKVMEIIGAAHEELGETVSAEPCWCQIESPHCVDMQIVDLPGFRDFAMDKSKEALGEEIHKLVMEYMKDSKNVMLCVEQSGDAATMSTLNKAREIDPKFDRTILIRNKLDKYYDDLTDANVNDWLKGHGDLPENLMKNCYTMTLPWWPEGDKPPRSFEAITMEKNQEDISQLRSKGANEEDLKNIGFNNFVTFMDAKVEKMFTEAITPVLDKLKAERTKQEKQKKMMTAEEKDSDPAIIENKTRLAGTNFADCFDKHVMAGDNFPNQPKRMTLGEELKGFCELHTRIGSIKEPDPKFELKPSQEFCSVDEYCDFLAEHPQMKEQFNSAINGGAAFKRTLLEIEIFLRFSEVADDLKKVDVIQARGVSMKSMTWQDVVIKLLGAYAHTPLKKKVRYVAERLLHFFEEQKEVILFLMQADDGTHDNFNNSGYQIAHNETMRKAIYQKFDETVRGQLDHYLDHFSNMLTSVFANPWTFLKGGTAPEDGDDVPVNSLVERIPKEIESRSEMERHLNKWLQEIPTEDIKIDRATDLVQQLLTKIFSLIRAQICDQVELFTESFFKQPLISKLKTDMQEIVLTGADKELNEARRKKISQDIKKCDIVLTEVNACIASLEDFRLQVTGKL
jgi:GTP-binding protein EngB required for normal cell division